MADAIAVLNPIWWVQFRLQGGPRKLISFALGWAGILIAGTFAARYYWRDEPIAAFCDGVVYILAGAQAFILIAGGCNSTYRALVRDLEHNMLESHKLSPMSARAVILGYAVGPNIRLLTLYLIGTFFGVIVIHSGTIGLDEWLLGNLFLLVVAPLVWSATVLLGMGRKKPTNPSSVLFVMLVTAFIQVLVPALGIFTGLYAGITGVSLMAGNPQVPSTGLFVLAIVTIFITVIWVHAAARKFRRPDLPAFGTFRALGLFVIWLAFTTVAMIAMFGSSDLGLGLIAVEKDRRFRAMVYGANFGMSLLIALFPIAAVVDARCHPEKHASRTRRAGALLPAVAPTICVVLMFVLPATNPTIPTLSAAAYAFASAVAALIAVEGVFTSRYSRNRAAATTVVVFIMILWLFPVLADLFYSQMMAANDFVAPTLSVASGFSPIGSIIEMFHPMGIDLRPGLAFQIILAVGLTLRGRRALRASRALRKASTTPRAPEDAIWPANGRT